MTEEEKKPDVDASAGAITPPDAHGTEDDGQGQDPIPGQPAD